MDYEKIGVLAYCHGFTMWVYEDVVEADATKFNQDRKLLADGDLVLEKVSGNWFRVNVGSNWEAVLKPVGGQEKGEWGDHEFVDRMAAAALQGMLNGYNGKDALDAKETAKMAYVYAFNMLLQKKECLRSGEYKES